MKMNLKQKGNPGKNRNGKYSDMTSIGNKAEGLTEINGSLTMMNKKNTTLKGLTNF
jgi:hypothetical protein